MGLVDPSGLASITVDIPIDGITDETDAGSAEGDVDAWLADVGFYDEYPGWYIEYVDVDGAWFRVHLTDGDDTTDVCDLSRVPVFSTEMIGGVQVVLIDGIGRLDSADRTLNKILGAKFHEMNGLKDYGDWRANLAMHFFYLKNSWDSPFYTSSIKRWKYGGHEWNNVEINYIAGGHVMAHLGIPSDVAWFLVCEWKQYNYDVDPSAGTWRWFNKGYIEYNKRKDW